MSVPDLVVLGGGIAGLTTALAAAHHGLRVTVIDQARPGSASRASAGMLAPSVEGLPANVLPAATAARDFYPRFLRTRLAGTEVEVSLDREGILELATTEADLARLTARYPAPARRLGAAELTALEPAFAPFAGAMLHPDDGAVDNVALMRALDVAVAREALVTRVTDEVASFDAGGNLPAFRSRGGTRYASRRLLVANGAWAGSLPGLPRPLPVRPVRGELLRLEGLPIRHVTYGAGGYLVPRQSTLLVGATSEEAGFASVTTSRGLNELRAIAARAIPVLAHATVVEHWAGLRPVSPDGLPILGADPSRRELFYACGFSRNGILLAPWVAEQLATELADGTRSEALAPFRIERFSAITGQSQVEG
ncbi:MAG TPA: FAD-dependent oxidoreductase [Gemmatimonadaceae bacterium]|jgi:glycine oxidase